MLIKLYMKKTVNEAAGAASNKFPFASVKAAVGELCRVVELPRASTLERSAA